VGRKTPPETIDQIVQAGAAGVPAAVIAQETELTERMVRGLLRKHGAAVNLLRDFKRDVYLSVWQRIFLETVEALDQARVAGTLTWGDRQRAAITLGIATEKTLLLSGQPTQIVAGIHEHRLALPALLARLQGVGRRIEPQTGSTAVSAPRSA
jgi:hypothetical protein